MSMVQRLVKPTVALAAVTVLAGAASTRDIPSAFHVSKSNNRNEVRYAVHVDDRCDPAGTAPVHPYWQMLEKGPHATEGLTDREAKVLGVGRQAVEGDEAQVALRGFPSRPISIRTWKAQDGTCASAAYMTVHGTHARLNDIHVVLSLFGVDYVQLSGWSDDGAFVRERVEP